MNHHRPAGRRVQRSSLVSLFVLTGLIGCGGDDSATSTTSPYHGDASVDGDASTNHDGAAGSDGGGCAAGAIACAGSCVDPQTSPQHCGTCGHACGATEECKAGACQEASCDEPCTNEGAHQCSGTGVQTCAQNTAAGCLEWSPVDPCPAGAPCDAATQACGKLCGAECEPFSVVLLPDTQNYRKQANNASNSYRKQTKWIVDHQKSENIKFVIHLGDITNDNLDTQWELPVAAHTLLDNASVPYGLLPGNHDFRVNGVFDRGGSLLDKYFPASHFDTKPWYGGHYGSSYTNNYHFFEVGLLKFMVISLEYAPRKEVLCWAEDLIEQNPDRRVILATHCFMNAAGNMSTGCPNPDYATPGATGPVVFSELAARHSKVFLVVSGHIGASSYKLRKGYTGNDVHGLVVDYQFEGVCTKSNPSDCTNNCQTGDYTGNGWFRQLKFDPLKDTVHAETLTVEDGNTNVFPGGKPTFFCSELYAGTQSGDAANNYPSDPTAQAHLFDFPYSMSTSTPYARDDGGKLAFIDRTVNSAGAGDQILPKVAMAPTGAFVAAWEDDSSPDDGAGNHDIMVRGLAAGGCSGFHDLVVNTNKAGQQSTPAIAMDALGRFVVVWADDPDANGVFQIRGRGFNADGTERIAEFTVNSAAAGQQRHPAIAMAPDGRFVVAWEDDSDGDGNAQIFVRGFDAGGVQSFADESVHTDVLGKRERPAVGMDANANFIVAWRDDSDSNGSYQIHARGFNASGTQKFARITVNSVATGQQRNPAIGVDKDGAFVVAWEDDPQSDGNYQVFARGFTAQGTQRFADFKVHGSTAGQHVAIALAMEPQGTFAIAWQDDADGNGMYQVKARRFHADGTELSAEANLNTVASGQQRNPHLGLNATGTMVAIWEDDMDGNNAYQLVARGFDSP
jgi:hypothetical protein